MEKLDTQQCSRVNEREEKRKRSECAAALLASSPQTTRAKLGVSMDTAKSQMDSCEKETQTNTDMSQIVEMDA